ncbi:periplasmic divalent cation tolerance protein [Plasmodium gonderi]|uniref:Periplasmic divalent cation tolerance protein n=1 Tax=Plasmodium gonderi TaxID=77519 RepID=A0A1Y1JQT0_PLAGO|nr:periplasmic divalent cation tolerance protein [Plasmodium gonderi]GAW83858.1 periplasmic divalent cation tolerance protein [Plasmodium gonderi]
MLFSLAVATTKRCNRQLFYSLFINNISNCSLLTKGTICHNRNNKSYMRNFSIKMDDPAKFIAVYVTAPSKEVAEKISNVLLEDKLASCINIIPGVTSLYHWKGEIAKDSEVLMMIKTKKSLFDEIVKSVKSNHPYEIPEVISVPIQGSKDYLNWIKDSVKLTSEKSD